MSVLPSSPQPRAVSSLGAQASDGVAWQAELLPQHDEDDAEAGSGTWFMQRACADEQACLLFVVLFAAGKKKKKKN